MNNHFHQKLAHWHQSNERDLPWVNEKDPYLIWLSEIILQQTRVDQGIKYYLRFKKKYPNVEMLAHANETDILKMWEGLGYNTRARNLHATAKNIVYKYNGHFPNTYEKIAQLKGIGSYTAAAIASFAFNLPYAAIDANVIRIYSRMFGIEDELNSSSAKQKIRNISKNLFDANDPAKYNQAIMDFGAQVCTPKNPSCHFCPFSSDCFAFKKDIVLFLPYKKKIKNKRRRHFHYLILRNKNRVLIEQRKQPDIWKHLFQFFLIETTPKDLQFPLLTNNSIKKFLESHFQIESIKKYKTNQIIYAQSLTHQKILSRFYHIEVDLKKTEASHPFIFINSDQIKDYALPGIIRNYLQKNVYF